MRRRKVLLTVLLALVAGAAPVAAGAAGAAETKPDPAGTPGPAADARSGARTASPRVESAAGAIQSRIQAYVRANGTRYTFAAYADVTTDRVRLQSDAPASVVSSLVGEHAALTDVWRSAVEDASRKSDTAPFYGGAGIRGGSGGLCSSGYSVKTTSGNRFQVTAGHCWAENTTVTTELGGTVFGWVIFPKTSGIDAELIGGKSYGNRIFVGGTNSSSSEHVEGAADPLAGKYAHYCHSGRTTGEHCGHFVVSTLGLVCTNSGCKLPVSVFIGGTMIDEGDSGGPFYAYGADGEGVHIRGHVIAFGGNGLVGYAEKWSKVSASYGGLLIVT